MKKIIVVKTDGSISIIHPNQKKYGDEDGKKPYSECKMLQLYPDQEWFVTDQVIDKSDLESRKQLYVEAGTTEIKKDLTWEKMLMPDQLIKRKHLKALQKEFEEELEKSNADPLVCMRLNSQINKDAERPAGPNNDSEFWSAKALERLSKASKAKPEIEAKLNAKLAKLRK
jgi:hypothetical protein